MRDRSLYDDTHDPFGWIKTAALVIVLFVAMLLSAMALARAESACAPACRSRHNECRLATKGAPQCDAQLQACVTTCLASRSASPPASAQTLLPTREQRR